MEGSADPEATYLRDVLPAKLRIADDYVSHVSMGSDLAILFRKFLAVVGIRKTRGGE